MTKPAPTRATARSCSTAAAELFAQHGTDVRWRRWPSGRVSASARSTATSRRATRWSRRPTPTRSTASAHAPDELLAAHPPDVALAEWMDRFVAYAAAKSGMAARCSGRTFRTRTCSPTPAADDRRDRPAARRRRRRGTLRSDVDAEDVLRAMGSVWQATTGSEHARTPVAPDHGRPSLRDLNSAAAATAPTTIAPAHQASATSASLPTGSAEHAARAACRRSA